MLFRNKFAVLLFSVLLISCSQESDLKQVHDALFAYFHPGWGKEDGDEKSRSEHAQRIWQQISDSPLWVSQLKLFKTLFLNDLHPEKLTDAFFLKMINKANASQQRFLFELRKQYLSVIYEDAYAGPLADIQLPERRQEQEKIKLPSSKLQVQGNQIQHREGMFDYVIVGSGPAGSLIASEFTSKFPEAKILLLDAGSFLNPGSIDTSLDPDFIESQNQRTTDSGGIILRNGEAIGGATIANIDLAFSPTLPSIKQKLASWLERGLIPSRFLHQTDSDWKVLSVADLWVREKIGTRQVDLSEINANNQILLHGISTAKTYDLNQKPYKSRDVVHKISALDKFIVPALERNLSVLPNAEVTKIIFDTSQPGKRAEAVEVRSREAIDKAYIIKDPNQLGLDKAKTYRIKAKNIILSAGTLGSASILLRSKIKNDLVGRGIVLHPAMGVVGEFDHRIDVHQGLSASVYATAENPNDDYYFEAMGDVPSFISLIHPGTGAQIQDMVKNFRYLGGFGVMLIDTPDPHNRITVDLQTSQADVHYILAEGDKVRLRKALMRATEILFNQGAKKVFIPSQELRRFLPGAIFNNFEQAVDTIPKLQFIDNLNFMTSAHMQGSNKIGSSPDTSVVSHNFKVWDVAEKKEIENLYVVDSSIFPTSVGGNPMQSVYCFAKIFVDNYHQ